MSDPRQKECHVNTLKRNTWWKFTTKSWVLGNGCILFCCILNILIWPVQLQSWNSGLIFKITNSLFITTVVMIKCSYYLFLNVWFVNFEKHNCNLDQGSPTCGPWSTTGPWATGHWATWMISQCTHVCTLAPHLRWHHASVSNAVSIGQMLASWVHPTSANIAASCQHYCHYKHNIPICGSIAALRGC